MTTEAAVLRAVSAYGALYMGAADGGREFVSMVWKDCDCCSAGGWWVSRVLPSGQFQTAGPFWEQGFGGACRACDGDAAEHAVGRWYRGVTSPHPCPLSI